MNRLALFADPRQLASRVLLPATLEAVAQRSDMRCVALLVPTLSHGGREQRRWRRDRALRRLQVMLGSGRWERALDVGPLDPKRLAERYGIEAGELPDGDPNHPEVVRHVRETLRADLALSLPGNRRFHRELLDCFAMGVNYHNGSLPAFRGLRASNWSMYSGEASSGYAFHRLDDDLDSGPVIARGEVPVDGGQTPADLELRKAVAARALLPAVLDALASRAPGTPQQGVGCIHNRQAYNAITRVADPSSLTHREWQRRLHAFLRVDTLLAGRWLPVTGVSLCRAGSRAAFPTADGRWLKVTGVDFWPAAWARLHRAA